MLAYITEKLKGQHISDATDPSICDINLVQGKKKHMKSNPNSLDKRSRKSSTHIKAAKNVDVPPSSNINTHQKTPSLDSSLLNDPPKKKLCLTSHHSDCLPWGNHITAMSPDPVQNQTSFSNQPINFERSFNFSSPNIGDMNNYDTLSTPALMPRPASASSSFYDKSFKTNGYNTEVLNSQTEKKQDIYPNNVYPIYDRTKNTFDMIVQNETGTKPPPWSFHFRSLSLEEHLPPHSPQRRFRYTSPSYHHIPRCHSQPCVASDKKCGMKRRRDHDRPTLDFDKMTETAYHGGVEKRQSCNRTRHRSACSWSSRFKEELLPIASSPLDHDSPLYLLNSPISPNKCTSDTAITDLDTVHAYSLTTDVGTDSGCSDMDDREIGSLSTATDTGCHDNTDNEDNDMYFPITDIDLDEMEKF